MSNRQPAFVPDSLEWRSIRDVAHALGYSYTDPKTFRDWCEAMNVPVMHMSPQQAVVHLPSVQQALDLMWRASTHAELSLEEAEQLANAYQNKPKTAEQLNVLSSLLRAWATNNVKLTAQNKGRE